MKTSMFDLDKLTKFVSLTVKCAVIRSSNTVVSKLSEMIYSGFGLTRMFISP